MTAPVGPLASEAAQLLDVLAARLRQLRDRQRRPAAGGENPSAGDENAGGGDENTGGGGESPGGGEESPTADDGNPGDAHPGGSCPQCGHDPAAVSCTGCPWCGALALLRGERPESAARLVDGALTIVQALRGLLTGAAEGPTAPSPAETGGSGGRGEAVRSGDDADSGLIRIEVR